MGYYVSNSYAAQKGGYQLPITTGSPTPYQIGTVFSDPFNAGDYTTVGSAVAIFEYDGITLSGGATGLNDYIRYNGWVTNRKKFSNTLNIKVLEFNPTSYGMGLKLQSINSGPASTKFSFTVYIVTSNNSENGKIYFYATDIAGNENFVGASAPLSNLPALNDDLELMVNQDNCGIVVTAYNLTADPSRSSPTTYTYNFNLSYPFTNPVYHNTAKLCLAAFGGTHKVTGWNFSSSEYVYSHLLAVGDSKTIGFGVTDESLRYAGLFQTNNPSWNIAVNGGGSDKTEEILASLPELVSYKAIKVILFIGRNDIANSIPPATWQANYQAIVAGLVAAGCEVWHQLPLPETVLDQSALTTWLSAEYPTRCIPVPSAWNAATDNVADGIHPDDGGHSLAYTEQSNYI